MVGVLCAEWWREVEWNGVRMIVLREFSLHWEAATYCGCGVMLSVELTAFIPLRFRGCSQEDNKRAEYDIVVTYRHWSTLRPHVHWKFEEIGQWGKERNWLIHLSCSTAPCYPFVLDLHSDFLHHHLMNQNVSKATQILFSTYQCAYCP